MCIRDRLHEHEGGSLLQAAHQVMAHGNQRRRIGGIGIIVPGHHIHISGPFLVIESLIEAHQVGRHRNMRGNSLDRFILSQIIMENGIGIEPAVIQGNSLKCGAVLGKMLALQVGNDDFIPIIEGMSPEAGDVYKRQI